MSFVFANQGEDVLTIQHCLEEGQLVLGNVLLDPRKGLGQKCGSMALPTTLFYDAAGRLVDTPTGSAFVGIAGQQAEQPRADAVERKATFR